MKTIAAIKIISGAITCFVTLTDPGAVTLIAWYMILDGSGDLETALNR